MSVVRCRLEFVGFDAPPTLLAINFKDVHTVLELKRYLKGLLKLNLSKAQSSIWISGYRLPERATLPGLIHDMDLITYVLAMFYSVDLIVFCIVGS